MPKVTLDDLTNLQNETSAVNTINNNSAAIEAAIENTLSRDGTSPNEMNANLDMNNYRILNLPAAAAPTEPIRKAEFDYTVGEIPNARQHAQEAKDARDFAHAWATEAEDVPVDDGVNPSGFSAFHWAEKAGYWAGKAYESADRAEDAAAGVEYPVSYGLPQTLNYQQRTQARNNMGLRITPPNSTTNFYVRPDGNDGNNGLSNTPEGAFKTISRALDFVWDNMDLQGRRIHINVADGTYTEALAKEYPAVGGSRIYLIGNTTNPENCVIDSPGNAVRMYYGATIYISGFKVKAVDRGLYAAFGGKIMFDHIDFGDCGSHHLRASGGHIWLIGDQEYTISGNAPCHWYPHAAGGVYVTSAKITFSGTPHFAQAFARWETGGYIEAYGVTFTGACTGPKYIANVGGSLYGLDYDDIPGSTAGRELLGGIGPSTTLNAATYHSFWRIEPCSDDSAKSVDLSNLGNNGIFLFIINTISGQGNQVPAGMFRARVVGTPHIENVNLNLANVALTTGPLTGTTGSDGKITISAGGDGKLYVENRSGSSRSFTLLVVG